MGGTTHLATHSAACSRHVHRELFSSLRACYLQCPACIAGRDQQVQANEWRACAHRLPIAGCCEHAGCTYRHKSLTYSLDAGGYDGMQAISLHSVAVSAQPFLQVKLNVLPEGPQLLSMQVVSCLELSSWKLELSSVMADCKSGPDLGFMVLGIWMAALCCLSMFCHWQCCSFPCCPPSCYFNNSACMQPHLLLQCLLFPVCIAGEHQCTSVLL